MYSNSYDENIEKKSFQFISKYISTKKSSNSSNVGVHVCKDGILSNQFK